MHHKAFPVAKIHETGLKKKLDQLYKLRVLKKSRDSTWVVLTFIISKKNGKLWLILNFRCLNKYLVRKFYPISKIANILQKIEYIECVNSLDLNKGYYTKYLDLDS